jgi:hypothetical protein
MTMKTLLASVPVLLAAAQAHAVSIVSLHGGMVVPMATTTTDVVWLITGAAALAAVIGMRLLARKPRP